ncbi:MAG: type 4a pilus biogenesis protein PilO [Actinomycetota bacterium]|nr:MAG: type IV pilus assembly protein [Actinomycetota bacterium]MDO8949331.1 type 4a pilus biogenesis protein PilO [Actinomycetota bacterium]MDP3630416.1 type 4a pilus biogenesis protein PilO [Actinomycetota bacterium]
MNRLSARNQMIIAGLLIVAVAAAAVFLGILPLFDSAAQMDTEIADLDSQIMSEQALVDRRLSVKAQAAQTDVDLIHLANRVPESPDLPTLIVNLQDAANSSGLVFVQIAPQVPTPVVGALGAPAGYTSIPVSMRLEGEWSDLIEYVRRLSKFPRGLRITQAAFTNVPATDDRARYVEAQLTVEVYTMSVINVSSAAPTVPSAPTTTSAEPQPSQ